MLQPAAAAKEPIKLAIGVDAAYVAIYLSKQAKLFEKHGVNVELVQFTQGGDALDAPTAWSAVTFRASAKHERETRTVHRKPVEVPQSKTAGLRMCRWVLSGGPCARSR